MNKCLGKIKGKKKEREITLTGSLSIRVASFRAEGSLICSTCLGRNEGKLSAATTVNRRRWVLHFGNKVGAVSVSIFFLSPASGISLAREEFLPSMK